MLARARLLPVSLAVAAGVALVPDASAASKMPPMQPRFTWTAQGCDEGVVAVLVPADKAKALVPAPFTPLIGQQTGATVQLLLGTLRCDRVQVAGVEQGPGYLADAGLAALDADGKRVTYHLWQVTSTSALRARVAQLGVHGDLSPRLTAETDATPVVATSTGTVPWRGGEYALDVAGSAPEAYAGSSPQWWHKGPRGLVRTQYAFTPSTLSSGAGVVTAAPGSALADLMGAERGAGAANVVEGFGIRAVVSAQAPLPGRR